MWIQLGIVLSSVAIAFAVVLRGERWRGKHANDPKPEPLVVVGVSAFTGELIATGQSNSELGDGAPPDCGCVP